MFVMASRNIVKPYRYRAPHFGGLLPYNFFSGYLIMDFKCDSFSDSSYLVYGTFARITYLVQPDYVNRIVIVFKYYFETEFARISVVSCR